MNLFQELTSMFARNQFVVKPPKGTDYIALGVFADMLASDGFVEKSLAMEARAAKALQLSLIHI